MEVKIIDIKKYTKLLIYLSSIFIALCFSFPAYGSEGNLKLTLNDITLNESEGENSLEYINENEGIVVNTNTNGLKKGYYTSQISIKDARNWSSYGEISFYIKNLSDKTLKINLFIISRDGKYSSVMEDGFVLSKTQNEDGMRLCDTEGGMIGVNKGFEGNIHIPFENFNFSMEELENVVSFGIITTTEENIIQKMEIEDFKLITPSDMYFPKEISNLKLLGDKNIIKPLVGESIEEYKVVINDNYDKESDRISFSLIEELQGVSVTEEGRVTVSTEARASRINIRASVDNRFNLIFEANLVDSPMLGLKDQEGLSLAVPEPNEVKEVSSSERILNNRTFLLLIRGIVIIIIFIVLILYLIWRRRWKQRNIS